MGCRASKILKDWQISLNTNMRVIKKKMKKKNLNLQTQIRQFFLISKNIKKST